MAEETTLPSPPQTGEGAPAAFKIVKVRKPDGTIIKVKRPIDPAKDANPPSTTTTQATGSKITPGQEPSQVASKPTQSPDITVSHAALQPVQPTDKIEKNPSVSASPPRPATLFTSKIDPNPSVLQSNSGPVEKSDPATVHAADRATESKFLGGFARHGLRLGISSVVSAVGTGSWGDLDNMQDGDEALNDDSDFDTDDDDDDERDQEQDHSNHGANTRSASSGGQIATSAATQLLNGVSSGVAGAANAPTQRAGTNSRTANGTTAPIVNSPATNNKKGIEVNEKELSSASPSGDPDEKALDAKAGTLSKHRPFTPTRIIMWAVMTIFPLFFIVMGILTATLEKTTYPSSYGEGVNQANKIAVTLWPIVFAALIAQTLRALATYKVERGIRMMTLEQLINSNSVAATVKQPFLLWQINRVAVALFAVWALSPLASQALQRMSYTATIDLNDNTTVYYLNTWTENQALGLVAVDDSSPNPATSQDAIVAYLPDITTLMTAALLPRGAYSTGYSDAWTQPYVPVLEALVTAGVSIDNQTGYYPVSAGQNVQYASQYGIPIEKFPAKGNYSFPLVASYLQFTCPALQLLTQAQLNATTASHPLRQISYVQHEGELGTLSMGMIPQNSSNPVGRLFFASQNERLLNATDGTSVDVDEYSYAACSFEQKFVQNLMNCNYADQYNDCKVVGVRSYTEIPALTPAPMRDFTTGFFNATGATIERYIQNPQNLTAYLTTTRNISSIGLANFTTNLATLVNTFWQLGYSPKQSVYGFDHTSFFSKRVLTDLAGSYNYNTTTATHSVRAPVYLTSWAWLVVLLVSSVFLLLCGVASTIWDSRTIGPDVFGFASSVARRSKYIDLPKTDSTMDGATKARLMGDVRVMMQDVKPNAATGRIQLGNAHDGAQKLVLGRAYK